MALTHKLIASQTLASNATSITFSSIPQTYTDLKVLFSIRGYSNIFFFLNFNGSTSGYANRQIALDSGAVAQYTRSDTFIGYLQSSGGTNLFSNGEIYVPNYTNGSYYKTFTAEGWIEAPTGTSTFGNYTGGIWTGSTAAITSLTLSADHETGSTAYLYGISKS